jgi:hypothetical protein
VGSFKGIIFATLNKGTLIVPPEREKHMPHHFVVGDRVRVAVPHPDLATGQLGTVTQTYPMPGRYAVQFDGETQLRVLDGALLARVSGASSTPYPTMVFQSE